MSLHSFTGYPSCLSSHVFLPDLLHARTSGRTYIKETPAKPDECEAFPPSLEEEKKKSKFGATGKPSPTSTTFISRSHHKDVPASWVRSGVRWMPDVCWVEPLSVVPTTRTSPLPGFAQGCGGCPMCVGSKPFISRSHHKNVPASWVRSGVRWTPNVCWVFIRRLTGVFRPARHPSER